MRISEIFHSLQGEGILAGVPSVFVRTSGCNLRCWYCDTPYTSWAPEGVEMSVAAVAEAVLRHRTRHVVVTGGEPLLAPDLPELLARLADAGRHITVETAATVFRPIHCDLASLSPKLSNSAPRDREGGRFLAMHEAARWRPDVIREFLKHHECQIKFVVDAPSDMEEIDGMLAELPPIPADRILLMPQGVTREELASRSAWLATLCLDRGWRFCPRLHIDLYGHTRGT